MSETDDGKENGALIPGFIVGLVAVVCAAALVLIAVLGPAGLGIIHYRTSQSGIWQTQAFDVTDLILLTPLLLIGAGLVFLKKNAAKFFLVLTPVTLMYAGLEYGLAQEWSSTLYRAIPRRMRGCFWFLSSADSSCSSAASPCLHIKTRLSSK